MTDLARKLELDGNLIRKLSETDMKKISSLADKCLGRNFSVLKKENDIVRLAVILECAMRARVEYEKAGIDEKIYYDTMSDIKIWCENNGNRGLKNYGWLSNHVRLELFRIGRLQFQLYECKNKTLLALSSGRGLG